MPPKYLFLSLLAFLFQANMSVAQENSEKINIDHLVKKSWSDFKDSNFEASLTNSRMALDYAIKEKNDYLIAQSYKIIGANYSELSEFDKAIFYYNKSLDHANKIQNDSIKFALNNNLGNIYCFDKKQFAVGIDYYKKAIGYGLKIKYNSQVYVVKINITWAYFDSGKFEEGWSYLRFINKNQPLYGSTATDILVNMLNGMYHSYKNDDDNAEKYFKKAIQLGEKGDNSANLSYAHLEYSKFLTKSEQFKEAYDNLLHSNKLIEEQYNQDKLTKASVAGLHLEVDEYKREIDKIENEKLTQARTLRNSQLIVILFVLIICIFLVLIFTLYTNISVKQKANKELRKAKEMAEEASLLKSQFISTISHELRTPLYGVVGITDLLIEEHKELGKSKYLKSLKFSARYLLTLVNDLLQINKIGENKVVLESSEFSIVDEVEMIKNSLSFLSQKNNDQILVNIDSEIPNCLIGDKIRLNQIIMNLVSNAIKFTKDGEVNILIKLVEKGPNYCLVEFKVRDNGIGIAPADQAKVFDEFVQVGRKNEDYKGTGLGLTIVKKLLELFGSTITLKSKVGEGTEFTFIIPFQYKQEKKEVVAESDTYNLTADKQYKILVVEDNPINQLITKKIIEKNNYSYTVVDDGNSAIKKIENEVFDVILMDINMPGMNGFETTEHIRSLGVLTPVIALTASDKDEIAGQVNLSGINDVLIKPFEPNTLYQVIGKYLK
jgi:signal transduction histidine kinase/CheY-like chemotaxis protein